MDLFLAGNITTQFTTQAIICHFATSPESIEKARKELSDKAKDKNISTDCTKREHLDRLVSYEML